MSANLPQLTDEQLWEQYGRCIDEYRFQVNLNWSRSQYFFVLNVAILAAGVGLLSSDVPAAVPIVVFVVGVVSAIVAWLASTTQHNYYKNVRDLKTRIEQRIGLGDLAIATTTGMGGTRWRLARITTFQKLILLALVTADIAGLATAITQAADPGAPAKAEVLVQVMPKRHQLSLEVPIVFSSGERVAASVGARPGNLMRVQLAAGVYQLLTFGRTLCTRRVTVTTAPLQRLVVRCP